MRSPAGSRITERGSRVWPWALFGGALVLRLIHLATLQHSPFFHHLYIDPGWYDEWGQRIAQGAILDARPFFLDPLYPYFIGAIYALVGHDYVAVGVAQAVMGASVAPLVFLASRRWYEAPVPQIAGAIAAIYLPSIYFDGILMKAGMSMFLTALMLWLLSRALDGGSTGTWCATGAALGLGALTRGNLLLVLPILAGFMLVRGTAVRPRALAAMIAGCAAVLVFPAAHNYRASGELILTTVNSGQNFYIGNNPHNATGEYQQLPFVRPNPKYEQDDFEREAERRAGHELSDRQISRFWFFESLDWIASDPGAWLVLMGRKVRSFWGHYEIPDSLDYYLYSEYAPLLRLPLPGFGLVAPLGLLGALLSWPRRGWPRVLVVFMVAYAASVIFFFVFSRFRVVLLPALFVFAAYAGVRLVTLWRGALGERSRLGSAVAASVLFALFFAFVNLPVRAVTGSRAYRFAEAVGLPSRLETSDAGHFNLGVKYAALASEEPDPTAWLARAEQELRASLAAIELEVADEAERGGRTLLEAARRHPRARKIHEELGKVLARQGREREAIEAYRLAVEVDPSSPRLQHGLGLLHRRLGELEAAERSFRRALELSQGRYTASAKQLAEILAETGRMTEAEAVSKLAGDAS